MDRGRKLSRKETDHIGKQQQQQQQGNKEIGNNTGARTIERDPPLLLELFRSSVSPFFSSSLFPFRGNNLSSLFLSSRLVKLLLVGGERKSVGLSPLVHFRSADAARRASPTPSGFLPALLIEILASAHTGGCCVCLRVRGGAIRCWSCRNRGKVGVFRTHMHA